MQSYKNLFLLGTSHIAIDSIIEVEQAIRSRHPGIIALELDRPRFNALIYNKKKKLRLSDIFKIGIKGYIFNLLGSIIEKKLGKITGVSPGDEMKMAVKLAHEHKIELALIDQDIHITLRNISTRMTYKERFNFLLELLSSLVFPKRISINLNKVPSREIIAKLTRQLKIRYPSLYKSLIEDRNIIMAKRLYTLMQSNKKVLAIVGAGHEDEIIALLKQEKGDPKYKPILLKPR